MENSLFPLNVNFVAQWLSGFVGEILTFAIAATRNKLTDSIFQGLRNKNFPNVREKGAVQLVGSTVATENNIVWDAVCVEETN